VKIKAEARPYQQSRRQVQAGLTRVLVLQAARDLLADERDAGAFTVDAVALRGGVSRATVFNLLGGKPGLLAALFDDMSQQAGLMDVDAMLTQEDAHAALSDYIHAFGNFYDAQRLVLRKLRAYAALDADFSRLIQAREDKRTAGLQFLVRRIQGGRAAARHERLAAKLKALLVLEVFESLAGPQRRLREVSATVLEMAQAILESDQPA
jgi:AcrR family transcriptional regulator